MADAPDDPRCPACGEPVRRTASYCVHCGADLTAERAAASASSQPATSRTVGTGQSGKSRWLPDADTDAGAHAESASSDPLLPADGLLDNSLTVVAGVVGGLLVGLVSTITLGIASESWWAVPPGVVAWLGTTAYLVRRRTVQAAVAHGGYALAVVLLLVPVAALSPAASVDGGFEQRSGLFLVLLLLVVLPAAVAAAIGWFASRYVPDDGAESVG